LVLPRGRFPVSKQLLLTWIQKCVVRERLEARHHT